LQENPALNFECLATGDTGDGLFQGGVLVEKSESVHALGWQHEIYDYTTRELEKDLATLQRVENLASPKIK